MAAGSQALARRTDPSVIDPSVIDPSVIDPSVIDPSVIDPSVIDLSVNGPRVHGRSERLLGAERQLDQPLQHVGR